MLALEPFSFRGGSPSGCLHFCLFLAQRLLERLPHLVQFPAVLLLLCLEGQRVLALQLLELLLPFALSSLEGRGLFLTQGCDS